MPLSWNEIRQRAITFSNKWKCETKEHSEAKSFWDDFFDVFGISRHRVASFEEPVKKLGDKHGFIDLFWKGNLIVEHKSKGKDLDKAYNQALEYFSGLKEYELPKYVIVSDFERFRLYDLEDNVLNEFVLADLYKNIKLFGFIAGYRKVKVYEEHPINIKAAERIGLLHDRLKEIGYVGHELEVFLVRLLFILFADDTGIFEKNSFLEFIENRTSEDGSDLASKLSELFQVLNTKSEKRLKTLDESYQQFPYINGRLFEENLPIAAFDSKMRQTLLECCSIDWGLISPAIFGSLFQSIMDKKERRKIGAHYTSEKNIMKVIKSLFLDELWAEFEKIKYNKTQLNEFHNKISNLRFLDPACGSGNFLIIAYRELRELELQIIFQKQILDKTIDQITYLDINDLFRVNIDKFYGIEIDEWAARIAEVAMWLIDHQMNLKASNLVGQYIARIPLTKSAKIVNANALSINWNDLLNEEKTIEIYAKQAEIVRNTVRESSVNYGKVRVFADSYKIIEESEMEGKISNTDFDYILGNPPYIGKYLQTEEQKEDLTRITDGIKGAGVLDYVACWFIKAAKYIKGTNIKVAFVSTNSITQGEQVGILWNELFKNYGIKIFFAHRTFNWVNEAKGKAAVHVVIIGFAAYDIKDKYIFDYEGINGEPQISTVLNINPYLIEENDIVINKRKKSICNSKPIYFGNMPNDGGHLLFSDDDKSDFLLKEPQSEKFFKPFLSAKEFLKGENRWCLWLSDIQPNDLKEKYPEIYKKIQLVKKHRESSNRYATRKMSASPYLFGEIRQPQSDYLLIPRVSSETRKYIPIGFFNNDYIAGDTCLTIPNASLYDFGILSSIMHNTWIKYVCGRLKSDYRYSNDIVYNNFPFPKEISSKQIEAVEKEAQNVIDIRAKFPSSSLAALYDPISMPVSLMKAHLKLDKAVDLCYRKQSFSNERSRIEFLFNLYNDYLLLV